MNIIPIIIVASAAVVALIAILLFFILKNRKNNKKIVIDDAYIDELIKAFGGINNISDVSTENGGRVAIKVKDLDMLNVEDIKGLATSGVFITGYTVKTLFREDSQTVKNAIGKRL